MLEFWDAMSQPIVFAVFTDEAIGLRIYWHQSTVHGLLRLGFSYCFGAFKVFVRFVAHNP